MSHLRPALVIFLLLSAITGIAYPGAVTLVSNVLFPDEAQGSLIEEHGRIVGSRLLGQSFASPAYFWSRPSATVPQPYNGAASSGSNQGPINPSLAAAGRDRIAALRALDPANPAAVPVDLVTASASGLDPHVSPAAAEYQIARVARARHMQESAVRDLVRQATEQRTFQLLGEARVNVLELNRSLDVYPSR